MNARYPSREQRMLRRAEKRSRELDQIWIRFAEAMKADGLKLGQFEGLDKFEAFLWARTKEAQAELRKVERRVERAERKRAS